jgi:hypothetical protein
MLRRTFVPTTWFSAGCACSALFLFALNPAPAFAQDAQAEAKARVIREKAANEDAVPIATPTAPPATAVDRETQAPAKNPEALKRRAGERVGQGPRGRALVLGMHLQELGTGRVNVVEVAAASPAFDAGVKAGDEIVSFAGFRGDTYRKWIEGISRLATDAEDNSRLPVALVRRGELVDAQIRIPESNVGLIKLPAGPLPQVPEGVATGVQGAATPGAGGNIAIGNAGAFGNVFGGEASPASEKAMAEIFRIGGPTTAGEVPRTPPGSPKPTPNARIGMAGFRDSANGMLVMVDVGALSPGNYVVAINDPSLVGGQLSAPGAVPNNPTLPGVPAPPTAPVLPRGADRPPNPTPNALPKPSTDDTQTQGNVRPAGQGEIPPTVLAQVADPSQPTRGASGTTIPPTGQVSPPTAPPTGQVNPSNTTPTGQSTVNNALLEQARRAREANAAAAGAGAAGSRAPNQIGTLTVDQSGTGRMQTVVEAMRVQDVVGQAIVLYSQAVAAPTTLPPNLDPSADPASGTGVVDPASPTDRPSAPTTTPLTTTVPGRATGQGGVNAPQPVAAGIIRLVSDRRPAPPPDLDAESVFGNPPQPAANAPPVGPNPIR